MEDLTLEQKAYLAASICASYGAVSKKQAEHMTINSFRRYTRKFFIDTIKIGMEIHGYSAKIPELEEKLNDPKFDELFATDYEGIFTAVAELTEKISADIPEEEIVSEEDLPDNVVIEKEEPEE